MGQSAARIPRRRVLRRSRFRRRSAWRISRQWSVDRDWNGPLCFGDRTAKPLSSETGRYQVLITPVMFAPRGLGSRHALPVRVAATAGAEDRRRLPHLSRPLHPDSAEIDIHGFIGGGGGLFSGRLFPSPYSSLVAF